MIRSVTIAFAFLAFVIYFSNDFPAFLDFPRSTLFVSYGLVFLFCTSSRFAKKIYLHLFLSKIQSGNERTLIVGAGDAGEQILRSMQSAPMTSSMIVGFVDDSKIKQRIKIHGIRVLGTIENLPEIVEREQVKQLIIALPSAGNKVIRRAVELGRQARLRKIKIAPPMQEIMRGEISLRNLRSVDVEDLLGRSPIHLDKKQVEHFIENKVVLITGAAGSIGSELSLQVAKFNPSLVVLLDQDETGIFNITKEITEKFPNVKVKSLVTTITDQKKILHIFETFKPNIVFHAAAYKHVPLMEDAPDQAVKNNVMGTRVLAEASVIYRVERFIFISTDKAVNPTSVMGATKRLGEMICQLYSKQEETKFISVRFGNVLNSRGSVIPIFKEQIRRGGPVQVTHPDMQRYFMLTSEACLLVMQAGAMGKGGEVFVLDMGKPVKILDLAREMISLSGFEPDLDIAIVFTGIRPGEKLFEEILTAEEGTIATTHQKIFMARLAEVEAEEFKKHLHELFQFAQENNNGGVMKKIKEMVIFYESNT